MSKFLSLLLLIMVFLLIPEEVNATLVYVNKNGKIEINVLSLESEGGRGSLQVKEVGVDSVLPEHIALSEENGSLSVTVASSEGKRTLNVTDYEDSVVELEEQPQVKNVFIEVDNGNFAIREGEVSAVTEYPIIIDAEKGNLMVETASGDRLIGIFPEEALQSLLRAKTLTRNNADAIRLTEGELGELMYKIPGEKVIDIFGFYEHSVLVTADVSATTGEILSVEEPPWLRIVRVILQ